MDEARLEELIRKLHDLPLDDCWTENPFSVPPSRDCPAFARLWVYASSGQPLGSAADHVEQCPRCQRLLEIMRQELAAVETLDRESFLGPPIAETESPAAEKAELTRPRPLLLRLAVPLAAAACIALLVWGAWPAAEKGSGSFYRNGPEGASHKRNPTPFPGVLALIGPCCERVYLHQPGTQTRGPTADEPTPPTPMPADLERLLDELRRAHLPIRGDLQRAWNAGLITSDEHGRLTLTSERRNLDPDERDRLKDQITAENSVRDRLVGAVRASEQDLTGVPPDEIRRALDQWFVRNVFGED